MKRERLHSDLDNEQDLLAKKREKIRKKLANKEREREQREARENKYRDPERHKSKDKRERNHNLADSLPAMMTTTNPLCSDSDANDKEKIPPSSIKYKLEKHKQRNKHREFPRDHTTLKCKESPERKRQRLDPDSSVTFKSVPFTDDVHGIGIRKESSMQ